MAIRTAPNRFAVASGFATELVVGVASYLDLRSLGAFACTDKTLSNEIQTKPLLYIRIRAKLAQLPYPVLSDQSAARLTKLGDEFFSRSSLRPSSVKTPPILTIWENAKYLPSLTSLQLISTSSALALHTLGERNGGSLAFLLTRARPAKGWDSNYAAAMDAHSALLRAIGEAIRQAPEQAGLPAFFAPVAREMKEFIVQCLKHYPDVIDKAKFHLLVGEWVRTCARAAKWDATQLNQTCNLEYSHYELLHPLEWEQICALATRLESKNLSLEKLCYLDLTNHDELKPGWNKPEPAPESAEGTRKKLEQMPVWEAMETLAENFEELLGDLSEASGKTLETLLERASFPYCWEYNPARALDAHAKLLRSMCPVLCSAHHDKRKKLLADFSESLDDGLNAFMRKLHHDAGRLDENALAALHRMTGELLRTRILALPSKERTEKRLNAWQGPCFGNTSLIDRASWDAILRLALSRTKEPLTYLDLQNEKDTGSASQASGAKPKPKEKTRRFSAKVRLPSKKEKDENKSDSRTPLRRIETEGSTRTQAKEQESDDEVEKETEESTAKKSKSKKDVLNGDRYDKERDPENCIVS